MQHWNKITPWPHRFMGFLFAMTLTITMPVVCTIKGGTLLTTKAIPHFDDFITTGYPGTGNEVIPLYTCKPDAYVVVEAPVVSVRH